MYIYFIIYIHDNQKYIIARKGTSVFWHFENLFILALAFSVGSIIIPAVATMTAKQRIKAVCGKAAAAEFISKRNSIYL